MYRAAVAKVASRRSVAGPSARRAFTTAYRAMAEGDTGAPPKTGGQGDAFHKRERAQEDWAVHEREKAKLLELKKNLRKQQEHLQKLSDHIDDLTKEQGGEKN